MNLNNNLPIAILGNPNTGKTNLMIYLGRKSGFDKKYIFGYPEEIEGFVRLSSIQDYSKICNCVLCIDEIDMYHPPYEKKSNVSLMILLKFAAHNRIKLIFTTQISQFVNKSLQAFVPCWAMTEIDIFSLKNGSKPKKILLEWIKMPHIVNELVGMKLPVGQYVWYSDRAGIGENGLKEFPFQDVGKGWKNCEENCDKNPEGKFIDLDEINDI